MQEIITINVGGAGAKIGQEVWNQLMPEHNINYDGTAKGKAESTPFFLQTGAGQFVPRNIFVDTDSSTHDAIQAGPLARAFRPEFFVTGIQDTGGNFANGYYNVGKDILDKVMDRVRKQVENADNVQGFILNHSLGGGTGSGLGSLILDHLAKTYRRKTKISCSVLGGDTYGKKMPCECYNELHSTQKLLDITEASLVFENIALASACKAAGKTPTYENVNKLVAKAISGFTGPLRFSGNGRSPPEKFENVEKDMVHFPRLHFLTTSLAPISTDAKQKNFSTRELVADVFEAKSFNVQIADFDAVKDKYTAIKLFGRGNIKEKELHAAGHWVTAQKKASYIGWMPAGHKVNLCPKPIPKTEGENFGTSGNSVTMLGNNVCINRKFAENAKEYDMMYSQRAYVHQYVRFGMEEGEFSHARQDIGDLEKDYLEVAADEAADDGGGDDDW